MDYRTILIIISSCIVVVLPGFYYQAILRGKAKPHRITRFVILLTTILSTVSLFAQHDTVAIWLSAIAMIQSFFTFLLSFKYGMGGWDKRDLWCLGIALFGVILWQTTDNPSLALYASIAADLTGMTPTLFKTYRYPETENVTFFALDTGAALLFLFAVHTWTVQQFSYPLYIFLINFLMTFLIMRKRLRL